MKYLIDTHLLLWAADDKLKSAARKIIEDDANELYFSSATIWEVAIKNSLGRDDFSYSPKYLLNGLLSAGYEELCISSRHALAVRGLPDIHKDPFDRIMVAQAMSEDVILLTNDKTLALYGDAVQVVSA